VRPKAGGYKAAVPTVGKPTGHTVKKRRIIDIMKYTALHARRHILSQWIRSCSRLLWNVGIRLPDYTLSSTNRQAMYISCNMEARLCNHCCRGKAINITYSECVSVALGIQHAMHMRHTVTCGLSDSTIFFPTLSHKRHDFRRKAVDDIKCAFWFYLQFFFWSISHTMKPWAIMYVDLRVNSRYSCRNLMKLEFSIQILEKYSNIIKICPVGAELSTRTDGQTDEQHDVANIGFSQFCQQA
jgi:hypothetical protein